MTKARNREQEGRRQDNEPDLGGALYVDVMMAGALSSGQGAGRKRARCSQPLLKIWPQPHTFWQQQGAQSQV